jgi:hypothetical protein
MRDTAARMGSADGSKGLAYLPFFINGRAHGIAATVKESFAWSLFRGIVAPAIPSR